MGGKALEPLGIYVRRHSTSEINAAKEAVEKELRDLGIQTWFANEIADKQDHGDLDVYYKSDESFKIKDYVESHEKMQGYLKNGAMVHTSLNGELQIDFIKVSPSNWETTKLYYNNGDMGNFLGKVCRFMNLKISHKGLFYLYKHQDILLSNDPEEICWILDLDLNKIKEGFATNLELFDFINDWKLSHPSVFALENLRSPDRVRNRKRKHYQELLKYFKNKNSYTLLKKPKNLEETLKILGDDVFDKFYEHLSNQQNIIDVKERKAKEFADQKKLIVAHFREKGFESKELGQQIQNFLIESKSPENHLIENLESKLK